MVEMKMPRKNVRLGDMRDSVLNHVNGINNINSEVGYWKLWFNTVQKPCEIS